MIRWLRWSMLVLGLWAAGVYVVACGNDPGQGDEKAQEAASSTELNTSEDTKESTMSQESPAGQEAGAELSAEPTTTQDAAEATPEPTNSEQSNQESVPTESEPIKPLPPWENDDPAPPKTYSSGTCPTLKPGTNMFQSGGNARSFELFLPTLPAGAPLLFMWHGLGDNPQNFAQSFGAGTLSNTRSVIIVVPKGISGPTIPSDVAPGIVSLLKSQAQPFFETWSFFDDPSADLALFDDVVSCLHQQYKINLKKVYTSGFSAGALWSTYLTLYRSEYLAASLILSGGVMQKILDLATIPFLGSKSKVTVVKIPYVTPSHKVPVMMTAGGPNDVVSMASFVSFNFQEATDALRKGLVQDKHFTIQCNHTAGHTFPSEIYLPAIAFLFNHEFSRKPSPFAADPLPSDFPDRKSVV